jgi:hypothetical protein
MKRFAAALLLIASPALAGLDDIIARGETLDFNLTWLLITGGTARMTIGVVPGDPQHVRMTSIARSSPSFAFIYTVRDQIQSTVNRNDFSAVRYDKHLSERGRIKDETVLIDERRHIASRRRPGKDTQEIMVPKPVFDPLSLVYHLRTLDLTPGKVHFFSVFADGKIYRLEAVVGGRETIQTPAGTFATVTVEPKMLAGGLFRDEEGTLTIWYTDDDRHIPVRIRSEVKVGTIIATLRDILPGATSVEPVPAR